MRFVTLFLRTENMHLFKDVGLLPYYLHTEKGVDAVIASYNNSKSYPALDELKGLKLEFVKKSAAGFIIDGLAYLSRKAKAIDVLNLYHLNLSSYIWSMFYRLKNPNGRIYLKLDMDHFDLEKLKKPSLVRMVKNATLKRAHIISAESTFMMNELKKLPLLKNRRICYIPNGLYMKEPPVMRDKQRIFLTVGRLGTEQKATEVLLNAYKSIADECGWSLRLAGTVDESFLRDRDAFFEQNPRLAGRAEFTGVLDKARLEEEYARAAVFVLPSRWESFGLVLTEATAQGCFIIATDVVPPLNDMTDNGRFGCAVPVDDETALASAMKKCAEDFESGRLPTPSEISEYTLHRFDWHIISSELYVALTAEK